MDVSEILEKLTLRQKAELLVGKNFWQTANFGQPKINSVYLADGPHGIRKQTASAEKLKVSESLPATCFPTAAAMANSWNEELGEELGRALGEEAAFQGVDVLLGPGLNIKRNPLCGRNFEYFSEDPYLSGKLGAAYVRGIQANGISACLKHFAANNRELRRMSSDSIIDERTLREIYLTAFEIAVKESGAKAVMSSYNKLNGVYADENIHLLKDILRGEWQFDGVVISDWGGCRSKSESVAAGSDLEMPFCKYSAEEVVHAVEKGELDLRCVDESVKRILSLQQNVSKVKNKDFFDKNAHHEFARKCAEESIVLLKNDGTLPLKRGLKVAFIGDFAFEPRYQGAGSSLVNPTALTSAVKAAYESGEIILAGCERGFCRFGKEKKSLFKKAVRLATSADVTVFFAGLDETSEVEGVDRKDLCIPRNQIELFNRLRECSKKLVVVLSCGCAVETEWCRDADALVYQSLSGQAGAEALINILSGKVNPSGKLAETFPVCYADCPSASTFDKNAFTEEYREGIYVGYRYYDTAGITVSYPFGHGLSYTNFRYSDISADKNGVSFVITNSGKVDGAEIVQVYVSKQSDKIFRPLKELKGFKKVRLAAGESRKITILFDDKTFRYYNVATGKWETEGGNYLIAVGASSADIRLQTAVSVETSTDVLPYKTGEISSYFKADIKNVSASEFEKLLGRTLAAEKSCSYKSRINVDENTVVADLKYSRGLTGRAFSRIMRLVAAIIKKCGNRKTAYSVSESLLYEPLRGIAKFGKFSKYQLYGLIEMFNGKFFAGLKKFLTKK